MKKKRIVTVGGGTGSFTLLSGLRKFPVELSAVVSMADDGGSTGVLRDELGVLPPGDVRQCLVALSESSGAMRELMNYRFEEGGLAGHSFGNLFLSALEKTSGSFARGVEEAMEILKVDGEVIPVTEGEAVLEMVLADGSVLHGENEINQAKHIQDIGPESFRFAKTVKAYAKAIDRVKRADMIVIGPGNFYPSLLPNLIIREFAQAIRGSKAMVVYIANLTNKKGHSNGWDIDRYAEEIERHIGKGRIDYLVWNAKTPSRALVKKYEAKEGKDMLVRFDRTARGKRSYRVVCADVVSRKLPKPHSSDAVGSTRALIRHDPDRLARALMFLLEARENERVIREIV
jgi:uncharacterized cofD-like protein